MSEGSEIAKLTEDEISSSTSTPSSERGIPKGSTFDYERWLDPDRPADSGYHEKLSYEGGKVLKSKGYEYPLSDKIVKSIDHESEDLLFGDYKYHTAVAQKREDGIWIGKDGKAIGMDPQELSILESSIQMLDPQVRAWTQDRIVARYLLIRSNFFNDPWASPGEFLTDEKLKKLLTDPVQIDENANAREREGIKNNPGLAALFVQAALAREAEGDALKLYTDLDYKNINTNDSHLYVDAHSRAVRRELIEKLPAITDVVF